VKLSGRTALVSGASRGIGLAIARALAAEGARVGMIARNAEDLSARAREIGGEAIALPGDIGNRNAVDDIVREATRRFATAPDIVVNNAGLFALTTVADLTVDEFARTLDVNLVGPFALVRAVLAGMRASRSGHIVTIGSIADRQTFPENGAYAASKFGLRALHQVLRDELRGSGVRATLVSPGPVNTTLWDAVDPDARAGFTPRASMLDPDSVADAVLWVVTRPPSTNIDELRVSRA
jgi:NADP-dependent 3-hydroxy acid dehydrogenase YdfG